jgi:hypothetical protein
LLVGDAIQPENFHQHFHCKMNDKTGTYPETAFFQNVGALHQQHIDKGNTHEDGGQGKNDPEIGADLVYRSNQEGFRDPDQQVNENEHCR